MRVNFPYFLTVIALALSAISAQAQAPAFTDGPPAAAIGVNVPFTFTYTASGSPAPTFSSTGTLPPGLTLSTAGVLSGTPTTIGSYSGTVTASNGVSPAATQAFSIQVETAVLNTVPEGVLTLDLPATTSAAITRYFGAPLTADPVYSGSVATITASGAMTASGLSTGMDTIGVTVDANDPAPFINGTSGAQLASLTTSGLPYFVKFLSGAQSGRVIKVNANTNSTLRLDTSDNSSQVVDFATSGFAVAAGDTFEVFPGCTLASVFGDNTTNNPLVLNGTASAFTADTVSIYNPTTIRFQTFYFNTTAGHWELSGSSANANATIIYPYGALTITRRANEAALSIAPMAYVSEIVSPSTTAANTLVPASRVAEVSIITKTPGGGLIIYGSTSYPVNMTFSQLALGSHWQKGTSLFNSDTISVYNTTTLKFDTYYQLSADSTWRKSGATGDQSATVIPAGTAISLVQRASVSGASSFLSSSIPYSLD